MTKFEKLQELAKKFGFTVGTFCTNGSGFYQDAVLWVGVGAPINRNSHLVLATWDVSYSTGRSDTGNNKWARALDAAGKFITANPAPDEAELTSAEMLCRKSRSRSMAAIRRAAARTAREAQIIERNHAVICASIYWWQNQQPHSRSDCEAAFAALNLPAILQPHVDLVQMAIRRNPWLIPTEVRYAQYQCRIVDSAPAEIDTLPETDRIIYAPDGGFACPFPRGIRSIGQYVPLPVYGWFCGRHYLTATEARFRANPEFIKSFSAAFNH